MPASMNASASLGPYQSTVDAAFAGMVKNRVLARLWEKDHTLWSSSPAEIANRLGWLQSPRWMIGHLAQISNLVEAVRRDGYTHALLLGMGGSSLAPEVYRRTFGVAGGSLDLAVLDSTDPDMVLTRSRKLDPAKTLFIVSTKSGGTIETFSLMKYFYNQVAERGGIGEAGRHFIAITDPGSALEELATVHRFRETFLNDPNIGGRYSALSCFGMVPAALCGMDIKKLLGRAAEAAAHEASPKAIDPVLFSGFYLGAVMGELARAGRDKLTFVFSPRVAAFGEWLEQLVAESTGKEGRGVLPVVGEPLGPPGVYGNDRFFVCVRLADDGVEDEKIALLEGAGQPFIKIVLQDLYDLGGQLFLWEMATAVAGHVLGVNPFDQPDVEAAKVLTRQMLAQYRREGALPVETPVLTGSGIDVYGELRAHHPGDALNVFMRFAQPDGYIAIQAYLCPGDGTDDALQHLRARLRDRYHLATTVGYGPRFLHSTGQFHKGGSNRGVFIQLTANDFRDVPIPDEMGQPEAYATFGVLKAAQALGDRQALRNAGRPVIRFHLGSDISGSLQILSEAV